MHLCNKMCFLFKVRTVVELVTNRVYYATKYSNLIVPLENAICRACNNDEFSELYEIAALASVVQCEIHSIYPYIDYRAEMKIINSPYKPVLASMPVRGRVFIFWTNTMDELSAKACPRSGGVWSPNHFAPLVQPQQRFQTSPTQEISSILEVDIQCTISLVCTFVISLFRVRKRQRRKTTRQPLCEFRIFRHHLRLKDLLTQMHHYCHLQLNLNRL